MQIIQISIFLENRKGSLAEVTDLLSKHNVNIRALSIADTTKFGILRIIVDRPADVEKLLRDNGILASSNTVLAVCVEDKPGGLASVAAILAENDIQIEYMYAFLSRKTSKAYVVMRVEDIDITDKLLSAAGYNGFEQE